MRRFRESDKVGEGRVRLEKMSEKFGEGRRRLEKDRRRSEKVGDS